MATTGRAGSGCASGPRDVRPLGAPRVRDVRGLVVGGRAGRVRGRVGGGHGEARSTVGEFSSKHENDARRTTTNALVLARSTLKRRIRYIVDLYATREKTNPRLDSTFVMTWRTTRRTTHGTCTASHAQQRDGAFERRLEVRRVRADPLDGDAEFSRRRSAASEIRLRRQIFSQTVCQVQGLKPLEHARRFERFERDAFALAFHPIARVAQIILARARSAATASRVAVVSSSATFFCSAKSAADALVAKSQP